MSSLKTIISYDSLVFSTSILAFITASIVILTITNRFFKIRERYFKEKYRNKILPLVYRYLAGTEGIGDIQILLNKSWYAVLAFQDIAYELIEDLKGSYRERMQDLLRIEPVFSTFVNQLGSFSEWRRLDAIFYIRHLSNLPDHTRDRLWDYLNGKSFILAHASASALMRSDEAGIRMQTLKRYAERKDTTLQSFIEILHEYNRPKFDQPEIESDIVPELLFSDYLNASLKIALLRCVPKFGYLNQSDTILNYLEIQIQEEGDPKVIAECIRVLGKLYYIKAAPIIRELALQNPHSTVRKACAFALGKFGTQEDHRQIIPLLLDENFQVRYEAAKALSAAGGQVDELLEHMKHDQVLPAENIIFEVKKESKKRQSHRHSVT